jgi:hypothetical protein
MGFKKLNYEKTKTDKNANKRKAKLDAYKKPKNKKEWK